jgi:hypothetical protein
MASTIIQEGKDANYNPYWAVMKVMDSEGMTREDFDLLRVELKFKPYWTTIKFKEYKARGCLIKLVKDGKDFDMLSKFTKAAGLDDQEFIELYLKHGI